MQPECQVRACLTRSPFPTLLSRPRLSWSGKIELNSVKMLQTPFHTHLYESIECRRARTMARQMIKFTLCPNGQSWKRLMALNREYKTISHWNIAAAISYETSITLIKQFITACWNFQPKAKPEPTPHSTHCLRNFFFHLHVTAKFIGREQRKKYFTKRHIPSLLVWGESWISVVSILFPVWQIWKLIIVFNPTARELSWARDQTIAIRCCYLLSASSSWRRMRVHHRVPHFTCHQFGAIWMFPWNERRTNDDDLSN